MSTGIDYPELIKKVLADDVALHYFHEQWERNAHTAFDDRAREAMTVRVSDSGACSLSLWADTARPIHNPRRLRFGRLAYAAGHT